MRNNEVDLAVPTGAILFVLKYMTSCVFCSMRLSKNGTKPILRFEFNFVETGNSIVVHDIPVDVLRPENSWSEPLLPDPQIQIELRTPSRKLTSYIDRLKRAGVHAIRVETRDRDGVADILLQGVSDSALATLSLRKNRVISREIQHIALDSVCSTVPSSGLGFIFSRVGATSAVRCILMICQHKYISVLVQLLNNYGLVGVVSPALSLD
jgi:hypothetical protein